MINFLTIVIGLLPLTVYNLFGLTAAAGFTTGLLVGMLYVFYLAKNS